MSRPRRWGPPLAAAIGQGRAAVTSPPMGTAVLIDDVAVCLQIALEEAPEDPTAVALPFTCVPAGGLRVQVELPVTASAPA